MMTDTRMPHAALPFLILVMGTPAAGKTTLAHQLARELSLPVMFKDTIKESLCDILGCATVDQSKQYGRASMELLYAFAAALLTVAQSCILECPFHPVYSPPDLLALHQRWPYIPLQVRCVCQPAVQQQRWLHRIQSGERHPGHWDTAREMEHTLQPTMAFLPLAGPCLEVDTTYATPADYIIFAGTIAQVMHRHAR